MISECFLLDTVCSVQPNFTILTSSHELISEPWFDEQQTERLTTAGWAAPGTRGRLCEELRCPQDQRGDACAGGERVASPVLTLLLQDGWLCP